MAINSKSPGTEINNQDIRTDGDSVSINEAKRFTSIESIWNNPNAGSTSCGRRQSYVDSQKIIKYPDYVGQTGLDPNGPTGEPFRYNYFVTQTPDPQSQQEITAANTNAAVSSTNNFKSAMSVYFNTTEMAAVASSTSVAAQADIRAVDINQLATQWASITSVLDTRNSWYDGNNLCARSCQVACQTACQTSCQGCNVSQCHNQKCGAH